MFEVICMCLAGWAFFIHNKINKMDSLQNIIAQKMIEDIDMRNLVAEKVLEMDDRLNNLISVIKEATKDDSL